MKNSPDPMDELTGPHIPTGDSTLSCPARKPSNIKCNNHGVKFEDVMLSLIVPL